tara:strand:- start:566 stop:2530 length:1965 start_codon:yes stop_codon:yes gene_type:complete
MNVENTTVKNDPDKKEIKIIQELFISNKLTEAIKEIKQKLTQYPKSSVLYNMLGVVLAGQKKFKEAIENYYQSIKINPKYVQAYNNLGASLYSLGKIDEAIQKYQKAIEIEPKHADSHNNLGTALKELGKNEKSIESYQKAIEINPNHADAHNNLGVFFKNIKDFKKSIYHYEKTIQIKPNSPVAYSNLGNAYKELGDYKKAISSHEKAIEINPKYVDAYYNLGTLFEKLNEFEKANSYYSKAIEIQPNYRSAYNNLLFVTCWSNNNSKYLKIAKKYYEAIPKYDEKSLAHKTSTQKGIKVGFVSGDYRSHSVVFFLLDTFKYLKKKEIQLFAYSNNLNEDSFTKLIKQYFDNWELVFHKTDRDLINLIKKDNLDILFDLSGHTANNRLAIFKNRCAPVQAAWCGWLASTGVKEIDYIVGDKHATPLSDQIKFIEKIYQLKRIWECLSISDLNFKDLVIRKNNEKNVIFGCLVNPAKVNEAVINVWSKILNQLPNAKLFFKDGFFDIPEVRKKLIKKFENNNVNKNQLIIEGKSSRAKHMDSYNKIDIVLDTFPTSGGTTSFEASYMGVPILTKINENSFWFRTGESINKNLNMDVWIAKDENDYIQKAIKFSEDKKYLINLKPELRNFALNSPLFNSKDYSNDFYEMLLSIKK